MNLSLRLRISSKVILTADNILRSHSGQPDLAFSRGECSNPPLKVASSLRTLTEADDALDCSKGALIDVRKAEREFIANSDES